MALIKCPECKGKISSRAPTCPHCGFPLIEPPPPVIVHAATSVAPSTPEVPSAPRVPPPPLHWTDRVPLAFLLFWGGLVIGTIGGGNNMVDALSKGGIQPEERNFFGFIAWVMMFSGIIWFFYKNINNYLYYIRAKREMDKDET